MSNLKYIQEPYPLLPTVYEIGDRRFLRSRATSLLMSFHDQQTALKKPRSRQRTNVCPFIRAQIAMSSDPAIQNPVIQLTEIQPSVIFAVKPETLTDYQLNLEQQITQHKLTEQNLKRTISALQTVNQELQHLAHIDALTQISNRRSFDESLHREWQRSLREQQPLSLVLLDIDFFKGYNDRYGHPAGDRCLTLIAQTIKVLLQRSTDLLSRYGGEEFAIILPNTTTDGAITVIHSIQKAIASLSIIHESSSIRNEVTTSLGLATMIPSEDLQPSLLLERTDKALYQAKQQGRDRYAIYG